jgi:ankyrin repeat protein
VQFGQSPLWRACYNDNRAIVKALLEHPKVDVNLAEEYGTSPLWRASVSRNKEVVQMLLKHPHTDVNQVDKVTKRKNDESSYIGCACR